MVSFLTVESRLAHVLRECGYPNHTQLMHALGQQPTQWHNWIKRGSMGRAYGKISEVTGASIDWLMTGRGVPFPAGPIRYDGPASGINVADRLADLERNLEDLTAVFMVALSKFSATTPAAGAAVAAELRAYLSRAGRPSLVLPEMLRVVEAQAPVAAPAAAAASSKKKARVK